jgi:hypothetical protein
MQLPVYGTQIFNLDSRSLKEVFRSVLNDDDPAKCRDNEEHEPKEPPEEPHAGNPTSLSLQRQGAPNPQKSNVLERRV